MNQALKEKGYLYRLSFKDPLSGGTDECFAQ
jgi:hypothetical protein